MKKILTEWRKFLNESSSTENYQFPEKVYYGACPSKLEKMRDFGVSRYHSDMDLEFEKEGIPVSDSPFGASKYGELVLEIDGQYLSSCGHYNAVQNSSGSRVSMRDSSSLSGSGVDSMVDSLGTNIPFGAVTRLIFKNRPDLARLKEKGFSSLPVSVLPEDSSGEVETLYEPDSDEG